MGVGFSKPAGEFITSALRGAGGGAVQRVRPWLLAEMRGRVISRNNVDLTKEYTAYVAKLSAPITYALPRPLSPLAFDEAHDGSISAAERLRIPATLHPYVPVASTRLGELFTGAHVTDTGPVPELDAASQTVNRLLREGVSPSLFSNSEFAAYQGQLAVILAQVATPIEGAPEITGYRTIFGSMDVGSAAAQWIRDLQNNREVVDRGIISMSRVEDYGRHGPAGYGLTICLPPEFNAYAFSPETMVYHGEREINATALVFKLREAQTDTMVVDARVHWPTVERCLNYHIERGVLPERAIADIQVAYETRLGASNIFYGRDSL